MEIMTKVSAIYHMYFSRLTETSGTVSNTGDRVERRIFMRSKKILKILTALTLALNTAVCPLGVMAEEDVRLPAFPGAEGGGKYTTGGRGGEVYVVTTLEDYDPDTEEPIKGSFRDAVSKDNRIIVFDVSGVIYLKNSLLITDRKNLTLAGQTAPGDGITIHGFETNVSRSQNIIMRYLRFRPGSDNVHKGDSMDAIWGRSMKDMIVDHISTSWSTDETMSLYRAENMTVQWSIVSESLAMSGHTKGRHGYGAIWGGTNATYHHNLIAHHTSRNPRFGGGTVEADDNDHIANFDVRNNVLYDWGFNCAYGGGRADLNYVFNYVIPGPGTRDSVRNRLIDCGEKNKPGRFYVNGNYMEGNEEVSRDNSKGIYISSDSAPFTTIVDKEFEMEGTRPENLKTDTPQQAYKEVLAKVGATYPKRDALDARVIDEVKNRTGRFANVHEEVGGLPYTEEIHREADFDKDNDGIADEWEISNGLDPNDGRDSALIAENGYANIENYFNSLVDMDYSPDNPQISISSPSNNTIAEKGERVQIVTECSDTVCKLELFKGDERIDAMEVTPEMSGTAVFTIDGLEDGTYYISVKATDSKGLQTQSTAVALHINEKTDMGSWKSADIGSPNIKGNLSVFKDKVRVKGAGKLQGSSDTAHFAYTVMEGNTEIIAKIDDMTAVDNHAFAGLMIRESLEPDAKTVAAGLSHTKPYEWKETDPVTGKSTSYYRNAFSAYMCGRRIKGGDFDQLSENLDSPEAAAKSGVQLKNDIAFKDLGEFLGYYFKLTRIGNRFVSYISPDGKDWTKLGEMNVTMPNKVYIGLAVDGNKVDNSLDNLNTVDFSHISVR